MWTFTGPHPSLVGKRSDNLGRLDGIIQPCHIKRRLAGLVLQVHIGAGIDKELSDIRMIVPTGHVERCLETVKTEFGFCIHKQLGDLSIPSLARHSQGAHPLAHVGTGLK